MEDINALLFESFTRLPPELLADFARQNAELQRSSDALDAKLATFSLQLLWANRPLDDLHRALKREE